MVWDVNVIGLSSFAGTSCFSISPIRQETERQANKDSMIIGRFIVSR